MRMTDQLHAIASIWAGLSKQSLSTLGSKLQNDSRFFARLSNEGSCTTRSFEKFLSFFRDASNWPDAMIPQGAAELLDNFENIAHEAAAEEGECHGGDAAVGHYDDADSDAGAPWSTGQSGDLSPESGFDQSGTLVEDEAA